jgi:hypothetical protein
VKDQYVGDVNDYLKYALLRAVAQSKQLAVAWMLTASDGRTDGQRLNYLQRPAVFRDLDPPLFDLLAGLVQSEQRTVAAVEASGALGDAAYLSDLLKDDARSRDAYFECLRGISGHRRTVFFDPDNGLEVSSVARGRRSSSKYLYWVEAAATFHQGRSLVIYQHFPRRPRQAFLESSYERARSELGCETVLAFITSHTAFLIVPQPGDVQELSSRLTGFASRAASFGTAVSLMGAHP